MLLLVVTLDNFQVIPSSLLHTGSSEDGPDSSRGSSLFPDNFPEIGWCHS